MLNTEGARKSNRAIIPLVLLFTLFGGGTGLAVFSFTTPFRLNKRMIPIVLVSIFLVFVSSIYMLETALYKNVRSTVLASEEQFKDAVNGSLIWEGFSDKKATFGKIFLFLFVILVLLFCIGIVILFGIPEMLKEFVKSQNSKIESVQIDWNETMWEEVGNGTPQGGGEVVSIFGEFNNIEESDWSVMFEIENDEVIFDSMILSGPLRIGGGPYE